MTWKSKKITLKIWWHKKRELICIVIVSLLYNAIIFDLIRQQILEFPQPVIIAHASIDTPKIEAPKSIEQQLCEAAGDECPLILRLAKCESNLDPQAIHVNTNGTVDMGVMQINSIHTDISPRDRLDIQRSVQWSIKKIKQGYLHWWSCSSKI